MSSVILMRKYVINVISSNEQGIFRSCHWLFWLGNMSLTSLAILIRNHVAKVISYFLLGNMSTSLFSLKGKKVVNVISFFISGNISLPSLMGMGMAPVVIATNELWRKSLMVIMGYAACRECCLRQGLYMS